MVGSGGSNFGLWSFELFTKTLEREAVQFSDLGLSLSLRHYAWTSTLCIPVKPYPRCVSSA